MPDKYVKRKLDYAKSHLKRVPLDLKIEDYERLKAYVQKNGETVNGFIKRLIREAMKSNNNKT